MNLRINTSDISRAFENEGLCENNDIQQKSQELDKTDDKNLDLNQHDSNLLKDLTDFTSKYFNSRFKNVDYNLYNFSSSITAENNLVPHSFTRSTVTKHVPKKQYCTFKQTTNDTKRLKALNSDENDTAKHSHIKTSWNDNTNLLLHKNQNDLIQEQYANSKNNAFLSFLKTISAIYINIKKWKMQYFLYSLNLAYNRLSKYVEVFKKLLIFESICKNLCVICDGSFVILIVIFIKFIGYYLVLTIDSIHFTADYWN